MKLTYWTCKPFYFPSEIRILFCYALNWDSVLWWHETLVTSSDLHRWKYISSFSVQHVCGLQAVCKFHFCSTLLLACVLFGNFHVLTVSFIRLSTVSKQLQATWWRKSSSSVSCQECHEMPILNTLKYFIIYRFVAHTAGCWPCVLSILLPVGCFLLCVLDKYILLVWTKVE